MGMHCLGCPSRGETVGQACAVHGVEVADLLSLMHILQANNSIVDSQPGAKCFRALLIFRRMVYDYN